LKAIAAAIEFYLTTLREKQRQVLLPVLAVWLKADEPNEREEVIRFAVFEFAIGEAGSRSNRRQSAALGSAS